MRDLRMSPEAAAGEYHKNDQRENFVLSEAVALWREIEQRHKLKEAAKQRRREHGGTAPGRAAMTNENAGRLRDQMKKVTGKGGRTMEKAIAIVVAAEADPGKYGKLVDEMDKNGADGAYRRLKSMQAVECIRVEQPSLPMATPRGLIAIDPSWEADPRETLVVRGNGIRYERPECALEDELFREISAAGLKVRRQVRVEAGVIDLLVDTDPLSIIEVKAIGDLFALARAAAQLWRYAQSYPRARLFVAAPPPILPDAVAFLAKLGMGVFRSVHDIEG